MLKELLSMIKIYSYSACGTCRKALKWLNDHGLKYELIEILTNPPSRDVLEEAISQYASKKPLFNTSGASYRNIGAEKIKAILIREIKHFSSIDIGGIRTISFTINL